MMHRHRCLAVLLTIATPTCFGLAQDDVVYQPKIAEASNEGELALQGFRIPEGMSASLFAAEPLLANPVAFCLDEKGRIYVAETFRQKKGVEDNRSHMDWLHDDLSLQTVEERVEMFRRHLGDKVGEYAQHHDRVRLLEDSDGDGKADKSTVFADGFNAIEDGTGAGLLTLNGDVYYTCIPKLWKLRDNNGDGISDSKEALHDGYGVRVAFRGHDLHGLITGPDGRIYFSIGDRGYNVVTKERTRLVRPDTGAVFRCEQDGSDLEVFAYGLRNPQELAFDDYGNLFTGDNNSDSGDKARWVYVVQDGDTGWRMYYQYLPDRGPWNRERLWHPHHKSQPAHIIPPIANLADGPSGLVHYPGTGLPERYKGHFFLCDFRGGPANSGIRSFSVEPEGATFRLTDSHEFIWSILGTDIDFGYDGSIYISDWVNGWDGLGKGRIYRFAHSESQSRPAVRETASLIREGLEHRAVTKLTELLSHPDRRVRQASQFAMVTRGLEEDLLEQSRKGKSQLARIHAIWGLGQLERKHKGRKGAIQETLIALLDDQDAEVRAQAIRILEDTYNSTVFDKQRVGAKLPSMLKDESPRVQYFAARALGTFGNASSVDGLLALLDRNRDEDPVLRHACVVALSRCVKSDQLKHWEKDRNVPAWIGIVLAMRRTRDPGLRRYVIDPDPRIMLEAARAIHDELIEEALPELAEVTDQPLTSDDPEFLDSLIRRVLNANFRIGRFSNANRVAAIASNTTLPDALRIEALEELKLWENPPAIDRVLGAWRPIKGERDVGFMKQVLAERLGNLLTGSNRIRKLAAELAGQYGISEVEPILAEVASDAAQSADARVAALSALDRLDSKLVSDIVEITIKDGKPDVRVESRRIIIRRNPDSAIEVLSNALDSGTLIEQQSAIRGLAGLDNSDADAVLKLWLDRLVSGNVPGGIQLELVEAATSRESGPLKKRLADYEGSLDAKDPLAKYRVTMEGGNAERGRSIFFGRSSASCRRCHKVRNSGGDVGPDLSKVGKDKSREYLLEAIVAPNAKIAKGFETLIAIMDSGKVYSGIVRSDEGDSLKLMVADGSIITLLKDEIDQTAKGQSAMPADLLKHLSMSDIRDLVEFMSRQKSAATTAGHE